MNALLIVYYKCISPRNLLREDELNILTSTELQEMKI
jgi:hypothetical protein